MRRLSVSCRFICRIMTTRWRNGGLLAPCRFGAHSRGRVHRVAELRFASSLEQSDGSYEVTLVHAAGNRGISDCAAGQRVQAEKESRQGTSSKAKARQAGKAAPQSEAVMPPSKAVRTTSSRSPVKPRVPKQAMDSLVSQPKDTGPGHTPQSCHAAGCAGSQADAETEHGQASPSAPGRCLKQFANLNG